MFVRLFSALKLKASAHVAVMLHGKAKTLEGGRHLEAAVPDTAEKWCEHYGVEVKDGNAMLFKAVDDDWSTDRARRVGITYAPGQLPVAADWDGGKVECGAGLHASPHPAWRRCSIALRRNSSAARSRFRKSLSTPMAHIPRR